jgi:3-mercaptopyruvate sulfurtransferase SseA
VLEGETRGEATIEAEALAKLLARNAATVLDLSPSRNYLAGHIPGAWFAIRTRLARALEKIAIGNILVLTSEDGALAALAVAEAANLIDRPVRCLKGGNAAWQAAGLPFSAEPDMADAKMADEPVDQWRKPYERPGDAKAAMQEYLTWEVDLLPRIKRDGSLRFERFRPRLAAEVR